MIANGGGCGAGAGARQKEIAEACKAAGGSALERVAMAETESGPTYKKEVVRGRSGEVVEIRERLDLGLARYGAQDHLQDMWREDQTRAIDALIMGLLAIMQRQGAEAAWASRYASWLMQISPSVPGAELGSIKGNLAGAMFGGRIDKI